MIARLCAVLLAALLAVSCGSGAGGSDEGEGMPPTKATKSGTGELRTDLEPLVTRFPVLEGVDAARWMSGTYGDSRNPGPSTYWIDAVIELPKAKAEELRSRYAPTSTNAEPEVVAGLRDELPSGPYLRGEELDAAFKHGRWWASAYLSEAGELVLVATGT